MIEWVIEESKKDRKSVGKVEENDKKEEEKVKEWGTEQGKRSGRTDMREKKIIKY